MGWEGYEKKAKAGCGAAGKGDGRLGAVWVWQRPTNPLEGSGAGDRTCRTRHTAVDRGRSGEV